MNDIDNKEKETNTKKLIYLVQKYPCLYDPNEDGYWDQLKRDDAWEKIASELNTSWYDVKYKWKLLRDSYVKHRRSHLGPNKHNIKYASWAWSRHLQFLNKCLDSPLRPGKGTKGVKNRCIKPKIAEKRKENGMEETKEDQVKEEVKSLPETNITPPQSAGNSSPEPWYNVMIDSVPSTAANPQEESKTIRIDSTRKFDGIDYLFMSYADTFRNLCPPTQAMIKLELATIFAEAEMKHIGKTSTPSVHNDSACLFFARERLSTLHAKSKRGDLNTTNCQDSQNAAQLQSVGDIKAYLYKNDETITIDCPTILG